MKLIQEIGSYAGFAAVVGLAVLSALYFSQARDVRRLRDWAGRAPERDAEARARVSAASSSVATPPAQAQQQGQAVSAGAVGAQPLSAAGRGGVAAPPRPPTERPSSGDTQILSSNGMYAEDEGPWYRRLPASYIALIVAGVIVIGGGIVFGALTLLGDNGSSGNKAPAKSTSSSQSSASSGGDTSTPAKPKAPALKPSQVKVQVFNGTTSTGLARKYENQIEQLGFVKGAEPASAPPEGFKAESVIFYKPGQRAKAQLLRKKLGNINNIEPLDDVFSNLTATATQVVLVVGTDRATSGP